MRCKASTSRSITACSSVVGRNGMGKTTLCKAIMGLVRASSGSIRFLGEELTGRRPAEIARLGIGYVPQGRRLWPSLTVDEHLRLVQGSQRSGWTIERIYEAFPQLAGRRSHRGGQLSGGEQQMLAISRALLLNPRLLVMDEPTEGLAPVIVAQVEEMLIRLAEDGDVAVLVIEQNIGVATAVASRVAIMVNGRINRVIDSARLAADLDLQQRLLGVGRHSADDHAAAADAADDPQAGRGGARHAGGSAAHLCLEPEPAHPLVATGVGAADRGAGAHEFRLGSCAAPTHSTEPASITPLASPAGPVVLVAGTLDTKGDELRFIRDILKDGGIRTRLVDLSTSGKPSAADVAPTEIALHHRFGANAVFTGDRGDSVAGMAQAFEAWMRRQSGIAGIIAAGGSGGTSMAAPAMRVAADRRAEDHDLHGRLRRRATLRRRLRHPDDVFGHRRAGPQFDLAPDPRQRRAGHARHGQGARRRDGAGARSAARRGRSCPRSG